MATQEESQNQAFVPSWQPNQASVPAWHPNPGSTVFSNQFQFPGAAATELNEPSIPMESHRENHIATHSFPSQSWPAQRSPEIDAGYCTCGDEIEIDDEERRSQEQLHEARKVSGYYELDWATRDREAARRHRDCDTAPVRSESISEQILSMRIRAKETLEQVIRQSEQRNESLARKLREGTTKEEVVPMTREQHVKTHALLLRRDPSGWTDLTVDDVENFEAYYLHYGIEFNYKSVGLMQFFKQGIDKLDEKYSSGIEQTKRKCAAKIEKMKAKHNAEILILQEAAKRREVEVRETEEELELTINCATSRLEQTIITGEEKVKVADATIAKLKKAQESSHNQYLEEKKKGKLAQEHYSASLNAIYAKGKPLQEKAHSLRDALRASELAKSDARVQYQTELLRWAEKWSKTEEEKKETQRLLSLERTEVARLRNGLRSAGYSSAREIRGLSMQLHHREMEIEGLELQVEILTPGEDLTGAPQEVDSDEVEWTEVDGSSTEDDSRQNAPDDEVTVPVEEASDEEFFEVTDHGSS